MKHHNPALWYIMICLFLLAGFFCLVNLVGTLQSWNWITSLAGPGRLVYATFQCGFLMVSWWVAAIALWRKTAWSILLGDLTAVITTLWIWIDRVLLTRNPLPLNRHIVLLVVNFLLLVFILVGMALLTAYILPASRESPTPDHNSR